MTHRRNRLARRKAARALPPTPEDMRRFSRLARVAREAAQDPAGDIKAVAKARNAVRGRTMPSGQAVAGSPFDRLCRMTERWPGMLATARIAEAGALADLADACLAVLQALDDAPQRPERADIHG
jgi:hypothetical protein